MKDNETELSRENARLTKALNSLELEHSEQSKTLESMKLQVHLLTTDLSMAKKHNLELEREFESLLKEKSDLQNERSLVRKIEQLEKELNQIRTEQVERQQNRQNRDSRLTKGGTIGFDKSAQLFSAVESKKAELAMFKSDKPNDKNHSFAKQQKLLDVDHKSVLAIQTELQRTKVDEKKTLELIDKLLEQSIASCSRKSLEVVEKIQELMDQTEQEKSNLLEENDRLNEIVEALNKRVNELQSKVSEQSMEQKQLLFEADRQGQKARDLEIQLRDLKEADTKRIADLMKKLELEREEYDSRIQEQTLKISLLSADREKTQQRFNEITKNMTSTDSINRYQEKELSDVTDKFKKATIELTTLRSNYDKLVQKSRSQETELQNLQERYNMLQSAYDDEIERARVVSSSMTAKPMVQARTTGLRNTNMSPLDIRESDFGMVDMDTTLRIRTTNLEDFSASNAEGMAGLMSEISEKSREIAKLREQIVDLKEQMQKSGAEKIKQAENELKKVRLELSQTKENLEKVTSNSAKMEKLLKEQIDQRVKELLAVKTKLNNEISDKEEETMKLKQRLKLEEGRVRLLQTTIEDFNKKKR